MNTASYQERNDPTPNNTTTNPIDMEERLQKLGKQFRSQSAAAKHRSLNWQNVGGHLEQMYMDYRDSKECKDKLSELEDENAQHSFLISKLLEMYTVAAERIDNLEQQNADMAAELQMLRAERRKMKSRERNAR